MPYSEADDTRKVQTAVTYGAESDQPVFLPYVHDNFDRFMRGRTHDDFYCGVLLGGCGAKLSPKRYMDKKCHFAHRPPVHCHRTEVGESSADHLYIGQAIADWLKQQASHPAYKPHGHQVRDVVDVSHDGGRRLVRVQLARRSKHESLVRHHPALHSPSVTPRTCRFTRRTAHLSADERVALHRRRRHVGGPSPVLGAGASTCSRPAESQHILPRRTAQPVGRATSAAFRSQSRRILPSHDGECGKQRQGRDNDNSVQGSGTPRPRPLSGAMGQVAPGSGAAPDTGQARSVRLDQGTRRRSCTILPRGAARYRLDERLLQQRSARHLAP